LSLRRLLSPLAAVVLLVAIWELVVRYSGLSDLVVAGPGAVARTLAGELDILAPATFVTAREALLGLLAAVVLGVALGVVLHLSPFLRDATLPVVVASQAVPTVVLAPLLVIAFGFGLSTKIIIVAIACFFPVVIGTFDGLRSADPQLVRLLRSLGSGRGRILWLAELPASLPRLLGGVRIAATWAFIAAVFAEYAGSDAGLGYLIARGTPNFDTARVYAAILILTAGSLALYGLMALAERRLVPWERQAAGDRPATDNQSGRTP
jgi:putative hydroxymethylpyrimidine transport system permease protein